METVGMIITGIVVLPLIIMAIFLLNGKGSFLVAGFNTMSKEERAKYDEKALCRFVGWLLLAISLGIILLIIGFNIGLPWLSHCMLIVVIGGLIAAVIYANTGKRFQKKVDSDVLDADGNEITDVSKTETKKLTNGKKVTMIITVLIIAVTLIGIGIMFYQGAKDPVINVLDNKIEIKSMYGLDIDFTEIKDITLIENGTSAIGIGKRTNGYGGIGDALKGNFRSANYGDILLFVRSDSSPVIHIEREGNKDIFINFKDGEVTRTVYNEMKAAFASW